MKKYLAVILMLTALPCLAQTISGEIKKQIRTDTNRVYDSDTNVPVEGAKIKIPSAHYTTVTDENGSFQLQTGINAPTIMSVEKSGYKPFSLTLNSTGDNPINVAISKSTPKDIVVDTNMIHIGDNSYSENSANAGEFSLISDGAFYTKNFKIKNLLPDEEIILVIGSIIGIDTLQSQKLGQSNVKTAYSSPPEIYFNNNKIADIKINGDNQKINIPKGLIRFDGLNNITVKTGRNLFKTTAVDYDDIEFTNLMLEIK